MYFAKQNQSWYNVRPCRSKKWIGIIFFIWRYSFIRRIWNKAKSLFDKCHSWQIEKMYREKLFQLDLFLKLYLEAKTIVNYFQLLEIERKNFFLIEISLIESIQHWAKTIMDKFQSLQIQKIFHIALLFANS